METTTTPTTEQITYTVRVFGTRLWPTGRPMCSAVRDIQITGDHTVVGGGLAIEAAFEQSHSRNFVPNDAWPCCITPNPALDGSPIQ